MKSFVFKDISLKDTEKLAHAFDNWGGKIFRFNEFELRLPIDFDRTETFVRMQECYLLGIESTKKNIQLRIDLNHVEIKCQLIKIFEKDFSEDSEVFIRAKINLIYAQIEVLHRRFFDIVHGIKNVTSMYDNLIAEERKKFKFKQEPSEQSS